MQAERTVAPVMAWLVPAIIVFVAGFVAATLWDLDIDRAFYDPQGAFAIFFESFAWYPAYAPALLLVALAALARGAAGWIRALGGILTAVGVGIVFYMSMHYLEKRGLVDGFTDWRNLTLLVVGVIVALLLLWWVARRSGETRHKLAFFALAGSAYLVADQVAINIFKLIWQRTRFDDMLQAGSFADFTPWFHPLGNGGSSFPSAHVANAACLLVLIVLCDLFPAFGKRRKLCYAICWVFIALMAVARMLMGRHFLSDTLAAAGIMALLFFGLRRTKLYKRGLAAARAGTFRLFGRNAT